MQSLSAFFEDNKPLAFVIMFAALLVLIIVLFLLYRFIFGRRLKATAGRARQPRLGIVDAFDLDRQRQLVLVRRDNIEHLIMIGGPNDVVIESAIVRAQSVASMPPGRDKDMIAPTSAPAPQIPAVTALSVAPAPSAAPSLGSPAQMPAPAASVSLGRSTPSQSISSTANPAAAPVVPAPASPAPPLDRTPPRPAAGEDLLADGMVPTRAPQPTSPPPRGPGFTPAPRPAIPAQAAPLPPRSPVAPLPPRPALTPRPTSSPLPPRPPLQPRPPRPLTPPLVRPDQQQSAPGPVRTEAPALGGVTPGNVGGGAPSIDTAPPIGTDVGNRLAPASLPSLDAVQPTRSTDPVGGAPRQDAASTKGFETLESLEEEMAKLLGRTTPRREG